MFLEIAGEAVTDGHGRTGQQQFQRQRTAHDIRRADHHRVHRAVGYSVIVQQRHHTTRCARAQTGLPQRKLAHVEGMKAVDVFVRTDPVGHRRLFDLRWQRQLHQDAIDPGVVIQAVDQSKQLFFTGVSIQIKIRRQDTGTFTVTALGPHIDGRCRITANQYHGQARPAAAGCDEMFDRFTDAGDHCCADFQAIQYFCF